MEKQYKIEVTTDRREQQVFFNSIYYYHQLIISFDENHLDYLIDQDIK